jgi:hypothetical protein
MNPTQAWNLLTARSPSIDRIAAGHSAMRPADIAALLSGLPNELFWMGMAYSCGDLRSLRDLERNLWVRVQGMSDREDWEFSRQMNCRRLAGLALYECIDDLRCQICNGKGTTTFQLHHEPGLIFSPYYERLNEHEGRVRCLACQGGGKVRLSGRKRADLCGISKDSWARIWGRRYEPVYEIANGWVNDASRYLAKRLRELEEKAA